MKNSFKFILIILLLLFPLFVWAGERVVTIGGRQPTRPITDFLIDIGDVYYVDSVNGDNGRRGLSEATAVATLDYAIGLATINQGDVIYVLAGHTETVTTPINVDKAGISIIGLGYGEKAPAFICNAAIDAIDVTAANVVIKNLYFPASTHTGVTSRINVSAANCGIYDCSFTVGQYDNETITITAGGDELVVDDCEFLSNSAAIGDAAIEIEAAGVDGLVVKNCYFDGYDDTQAWDTGAINSGVAHTRCLIKDNIFLYGAGVIFSAAATGSIIGNYYAEGTLGSMLDPGSCMCFENYETDTINETASLFPQASPVGGGIETDIAAILTDTGTTLENRQTTIAADVADLSTHCVEKAADVLTGADDIFIITGGPVRARLVGIVTTIIGGASNATITMTTTDPSATVNVSAGAVAIDNDAKGTSYYHVGATAVFTPVTAGFVALDPVTVDETYFIFPIGTVHFDNTAAQTGEVTWYMTYEKLSPNSAVAAAL